MKQLILTDKNKCNLSLTCIRTCPAKAIKIADGYAQIMASRCIGCGHCVTMCSKDAISIRDEKTLVKELINSSGNIAAMCDPAISGEFTDITDYRKFVAMIRALGFNLVTEVAFGVDLVALKYKELFSNFEGKYYISTKCPPVVDFIEKEHPELVKNLAPIITPFTAMAKVIHKKYGTDTKIVYITACAGAKNDARKFNNTDGKIDAVITFIELRELFNEFEITENSVAFSEFDPPVGRKGGLFPISHGMLQSVDINQDLLNGSIIITEGRTNFLQSIKEFTTDVELQQHLDLFYCRGCHMGPGASPNGKRYKRRAQVIKYVKKRLAGISIDVWEKDIEQFSSLDFKRTFKASDLRLPIPTEAQIQQVLHEMGKANERDQLGCGACGYPTCREFAIAYTQGLTNYEMCYTYTNKQLHTYINKVNAANEKLKKTQEALLISEEKSRAEEKTAREAAETITAMLDKLKAGVVIVNDKLKIIESNRVFAQMLGDDAQQISELIPGLKGADLQSLVPFHRYFQTVLQSGQDLLNRDTQLGNTLLNVSVFTIHKNSVVGGIIRDLTKPEVRREEIINRAQSVIRENLETVQQIAFLLGESASKTEKTLKSIIESQKSGDADDHIQ
ncbi:MAG: 4Fe-4S binding protein [Marinilabiliaceae bacterium]|nr:4Fe-4S binding protein [Marinilabiliaceae bacterium]